MTTLTLNTDRMTASCSGNALNAAGVNKDILARSVNDLISSATVQDQLRRFSGGASLTNLTVIVRQDGAISVKNNATGAVLSIADRVATATATSIFEPLKRQVAPAPRPVPMSAPAPMTAPHPHSSTAPMGATTMPYPPADPIEIEAPLRESTPSAPATSTETTRLRKALEEERKAYYDLETTHLTTVNALLDSQITPLQKELEKINREISGYSLPERDDEDDYGNADIPQPGGIVSAIMVPLRNIFRGDRYTELEKLRSTKEKELSALRAEQENNTILIGASSKDREARRLIAEHTAESTCLKTDLDKKTYGDALRAPILSKHLNVLKELHRLLNNLEDASVEDFSNLLEVLKAIKQEDYELKKTPKQVAVIPLKTLTGEKALLEAAFKKKLEERDEGDRNLKMICGSRDDTNYAELINILDQLHEADMRIFEASRP